MSRPIALLLACLLVAGCATSQVVPPATIRVAVVDEETGAPIAGATVRAVYKSPTRRWDSPTVELTDANGQATVPMPNVRFRYDFAESFAGGGVYRGIDVEADGYTPRGDSEGPHFGLFERSPPTVRLRPIRNRYGAVRIVSSEARPGGARVYHSDEPLPIALATMEVLDGPHAGRTLAVPFVSFSPAGDYPPGKRFYLNQPVEEIEASLARGKDLFTGHVVMRPATRDEPYAPPVERRRDDDRP